MCPNCIISGVWAWLAPGAICLGFFLVAAFFFFYARTKGEFAEDEEEAKYSVFD